MKGFDDHFNDLPDYILGITREIWEERGVGAKLKRYYADDVLVRAPSGILTDNRGVTAATLQTLNEFPDRQLVGEDVIWSGDEDRGFYSSHRLISVMRHTGSGAYGNASGRVVRSRVIADCVVRENQVHEEWLVRDQAAFAHCLGIEPRELAQRQVESDIRQFGRARYFTPEEDVEGSYRGRIDDDAQAARYAEGWSAIWDGKEISELFALYHPGATLNAPGGIVLNGHGDIDRFVLGYLSSFPDARLSVEHLIVNRDPGQPLRIAMRWSFTATHSGWGHFGEPTGAPVYVMGLSHAHLVNGRVSMEWVTVDEVAIWKQLLAYQASDRSTSA
ncbi:ester cyclase [Halomonas sp. V046]|uniref:ester cyclase n=1 Tax=Halomonas sp. V046 TaxID=3459611 RepID=UPI0040440AA5